METGRHLLLESDVSMTSLRALCSKGIPRVVTPARPAAVTAVHRTLSPSSSVIEAVARKPETPWSSEQPARGRALPEHICWNAVGPASATTCKTGMRCYMTERAEQLREVAVPSKISRRKVRVSRQESDINGTSPPKRNDARGGDNPWGLIDINHLRTWSTTVNREHAPSVRTINVWERVGHITECSVRANGVFACDSSISIPSSRKQAGHRPTYYFTGSLLLDSLNYAFPPALCVLAASLLGNLAMPPTTLWDDKPVKQKWSTTLSNWEPLGHPPAGTTIDLHIVPKPHSENGALIELLYEVSNPRHPKYILAIPNLHSYVPLLRFRYDAYLDELLKLGGSSRNSSLCDVRYNESVPNNLAPIDLIHRRVMATGPISGSSVETY
ncbi:hypothetical protein EDB85DRAFT_2275222 [Lactarius pseudohatsudake]|nr:hypothetical protein EDB85DRAFT_2275222 [Lactarius pseudohatsudake]